MENTVIHLNGFKGLTNNIKIKSKNYYAIEQKDVEDAICRNWSVNDSDINISVFGTTVTFIDTLNSWYQNRITWKTPCIWYVINELSVDSKYAYF